MTIEQAQRDFDELIAKNGFSIAGLAEQRKQHLSAAMALMRPTVS